jgi:hypothetical protein
MEYKEFTNLILKYHNDNSKFDNAELANVIKKTFNGKYIEFFSNIIEKLILKNNFNMSSSNIADVIILGCDRLFITVSNMSLQIHINDDDVDIIFYIQNERNTINFEYKSIYNGAEYFKKLVTTWVNNELESCLIDIYEQQVKNKKFIATYSNFDHVKPYYNTITTVLSVYLLHELVEIINSYSIEYQLMNLFKNIDK